MNPKPQGKWDAAKNRQPAEKAAGRHSGSTAGRSAGSTPTNAIAAATKSRAPTSRPKKEQKVATEVINIDAAETPPSKKPGSLGKKKRKLSTRCSEASESACKALLPSCGTHFTCTHRDIRQFGNF